MWIARDKNGQLRLFKNKPYKPAGMTHSHQWNQELLAGVTDSTFLLADDLFPNLQWEDEPIEVELVSKKFMDEWREKNKTELSLKEE